MAISVPCRITPSGDVPIVFRGAIPYFTDYKQAYQFLADAGYATIAGEAGELAIVNECYGLQTAIDTFGKYLVPYSKLRGHSAV